MQIKYTGALALLAVSVSATAATPQSSSSTDLNPILVTATRTDVRMNDTLAPVALITHADIVRLQPISLVDLLSGLPGVSLANSGGVGQQTSLFLRGTNSTHTLVLIDGVRVASVTAGLAALQQIPLEQIDHIEVVRGPRSSLYGADAIGGVIQIFTRHGQPGEGLKPSFRITAGGDDYRAGQLGLSGSTRHAWYNLSVGGTYTRGINSCKIGAGTVFAGCYTNEADADGYRAWSGLLNAGYRWDDGSELAGNFLRNKSYVEYDGSYQNQSRHQQQVVGARLRLQPLTAWTLTLSAGQGLDKASNYKSGRFVGYGDSRRNQFAWQNDIALADKQLLSVGLDDQHEHIDSDTSYLRTARENVGAYVQYQGRFGANEWQLSGRRDHNQQFGNHNTGALAWGYHFGDGLLLSASFGTAFHAPTFNDLYYPSFPGYAPSADPNLRPEKARNIGLGLGAARAHWHWRLDAYQNTIRDLITLDSHYTPGNISRARIRGLEAQLGGALGAWRVTTYATWLQPQNRDAGANHGNLLPRRFKNSARVDLDRDFGTFSLGTTLSAYGHRYDDTANRHQLGGYATVDLRASWQFQPRWQLQAHIANALDRDYETVYYYNQPGSTAYLTLRYTPLK